MNVYFTPKKTNCRTMKFLLWKKLVVLEIRIGFEHFVNKMNIRVYQIFFLVNTYLFSLNLGSQYLEMKVSPARYTSSGNNTFKDQK